MRSAIIAAAFAVTALAVPYEKRAVVTHTNVDLVYVTQWTTVTGGSSAPTEQAVKHYGHPKKPTWWGKPRKHTHTAQPQPSPEPTTTWAPAPSESPAPTETEAPTNSWTTTPKKSAPASAPTDYAAKAVLHHNIHRANHSAPDIAWDSGLEASAKQVADSCVYAHNT